MQPYYIYKITNRITNKNYIGQRHCPINKTIETDFKYMGSGKLIIQAENKYGLDNFEKEIIAVCFDKNEINILEKEYIRLCREIGQAQYNVADGGIPLTFNVNSASKENRKLVTDKIKNLYTDEYYKQKHSEKIKCEQFYKSIHSEEYKKKLSKASYEMWRNRDKTEYDKVCLRIKETTKGVHKSEQARKNISAAMKNSVKFKETMASEKHRQNLSKAIRGSKAHYDSHHTPEFINKMKEISSHRSEKQKLQSQKFAKCNVGKRWYVTDTGRCVLEFPDKALSTWTLGRSINKNK